MIEALAEKQIVVLVLNGVGISLIVISQLATTAFVNSVFDRTLVGKFKPLEQGKLSEGRFRKDFEYVLDLSGAYLVFGSGVVAALLVEQTLIKTLYVGVGVVTILLWRFVVEGLGVEGYYRRRKARLSCVASQVVLGTLLNTSGLVELVLMRVSDSVSG